MRGENSLESLPPTTFGANRGAKRSVASLRVVVFGAKGRRESHSLELNVGAPSLKEGRSFRGLTDIPCLRSESPAGTMTKDVYLRRTQMLLALAGRGEASFPPLRAFVSSSTPPELSLRSSFPSSSLGARINLLLLHLDRGLGLPPTRSTYRRRKLSLPNPFCASFVPPLRELTSPTFTYLSPAHPQERSYLGRRRSSHTKAYGP